MNMYKLLPNKWDGSPVNVVVRIADNAFIPFDNDNTDYQEYLKYIAEGGTVLPAEDNS